MNVGIEVRHYRSEAEIHLEAKARRKRFEMAGRLAAAKKITPLPVSSTPLVKKKIPQWELCDINFDAHIIEWYMRKANPTLTYLKDRCAELGWPWSVIISSQRRRAVVRVRQLLMWEASEKFKISLPQIGRIFGGRDHTTVLHAIRRVEASTDRAISR